MRDELRAVRAESRAVSQQRSVRATLGWGRLCVSQPRHDKGVRIAAQRARTDCQIAHLRRRLENQEALKHNTGQINLEARVPRCVCCPPPPPRASTAPRV